MKKKFFLLMIAIIGHLYSSAQTKPFSINFQAYTTSFIAAADVRPYSAFNRFIFMNPPNGLSATVRLNDNFSVSGAYSVWNDMLGAGFKGFPKENWKGKIVSREYYRLGDLSVQYNRYTKKHHVFAGTGLSYASGKNAHFESYYYFRPDHWEERTSAPVSVNYYGAHLTAGYNYALFKCRVNVGAHVRLRKFTDQYWQHDLNINLGYNFNLLKKKEKKKDE